MYVSLAPDVLLHGYYKKKLKKRVIQYVFRQVQHLILSIILLHSCDDKFHFI